MSVEERTGTERVLQARERYVPRGVSTPNLVVSKAWGAKIWDVDGREYLDFGGGIACQNLGHGPAAVVRAIHEQVDSSCTSASWSGSTSRTSRSRDGSTTSGPATPRRRRLLVNSGAEAIENAVKIARAATKRAGVVVFDRAFHGRTKLTMAMTSKLVYKQGFGPLATDIYRAPAPYPYRGVSTEDALHGLELLFKQDVDPKDVACIVLEPVQGEGGFIPMPPDFIAALDELCDEHGILYVDDEIQSGCGRTGQMWAIEHYGVEPDILVAGKTLGGGLPLASVTGRADVMDAVHPGGLGGTFGGNPVACAAAIAVLDELSATGYAERAGQIGQMLRTRLDEIASRRPVVGEVRGLGSMLALELTERNGDAAKAVTSYAFDHGLILLSCGLYGNVIRLLPPLSATDEELEQGLAILDEALGDAGSG